MSVLAVIIRFALSSFAFVSSDSTIIVPTIRCSSSAELQRMLVIRPRMSGSPIACEAAGVQNTKDPNNSAVNRLRMNFSSFELFK
jgi:hypothetical protein